MQLSLLSTFDNEAACQVAEALVLTVGVVLGWLVWPAIRQTLAHSASQRKEAALLQESSACDSDISEEAENDVEDEERHLVRDEQKKVAALFDHYGLFGAPLTVWNRTGSDGMDLEEGCLEECAEELAFQDFEESMTSEFARSESSSSTENLFEHYGLFGAPVGAWRS